MDTQIAALCGEGPLYNGLVYRYCGHAAVIDLLRVPAVQRALRMVRRARCIAAQSKDKFG